MQERPKERGGPIVSKGMMSPIVLGGLWMTLVAVAFYKSAWVDSLFRDAPDHIYTYTGFFCAYIFMAVANGFNVRVEGLDLFDHILDNKGFIQVMGGIVLIQYLLTLFGGSVLRTAPLHGQEWGVVIICALSIIIVDLLRKVFRQHLLK